MLWESILLLGFQIIILDSTFRNHGVLSQVIPKDQRKPQPPGVNTPKRPPKEDNRPVKGLNHPNDVLLWANLVTKDPTPEAPGTCREDGHLMPDMTHCARYWHCSGGQPVIKTCDPGMYFSHYQLKCDMHYNVSCKDYKGKALVIWEKDETQIRADNDIKDPSGDNEQPKDPEVPTGDNEIPKDPEAPTGDNELPKDPEVPTGDNELPKDPEVPTGDNELPIDPEAPTGDNELPKDPEVPTGDNELPKDPEAPTGDNELPKDPEVPTGDNEQPKDPEAPTGDNEIPV